MPVIVTIQPNPGPDDVDEFDPLRFTPEVIPDVDASAAAHKCACAASDDNPF